MRVSIKGYAKINLCLNVFEKNAQGFHSLESLVVTVDLYDKVTLVSRKDKKVTFKVSGSNKDYIYNCIPEKDNAFKASTLFINQTGCNGVDIYLEKNIPLSSGMGGSSACAAATLNGMEKLYKTGADLSQMANSLGSDTNYLLKGGWAVLKGRGDIVEYLPVKRKLSFVVIYPQGGVNTKECFEKFDMQIASESAVNSDIDALIGSLNGEELDFNQCKNALERVACEINPHVKRAIDFAKSLSPRAVFMTGSGSTVCMLFDYEGLNRWAKEKCEQAGFTAEVLNSYIPK